MRLAALLHDVAKPRSAAPKEDAPGRAPPSTTHEKLAPPVTEEILQRLKFPRRETERVALLVGRAQLALQPEWNDRPVRPGPRRGSAVGEPAGPLERCGRADLNARGARWRKVWANQAGPRRPASSARWIGPRALKITDLASGAEDVMRTAPDSAWPRVSASALTGMLEYVLG